MQEVFEKIIEKFSNINRVVKNDEDLEWNRAVYKCTEIVKQEAAEYSNVMIDGKYCFQTCACTEQCYKCSRLCNGDTDWYENIDNWTEEFATDTNVGSNCWIPCSERLPEESLNDVIGWDAYRERCCFVHYIGGRFILGDDTESVNITHWMPTPYQPKGE